MTAIPALAANALAAAAARGLIFVVRLYQAVLSPLLGGQCRFVPSCSEYFIQAVQVHGPLRGGLLGAWRIVRCNPLCRGGFDPVPAARRRTNNSAPT